MPIDLGNLILNGRDVALRPLHASDAEPLAIASAESHQHFRFTIVPDGLIEVRAYIEQALRQRKGGTRYPLAIEYRGRIVGSTSFLDFQPWEWPAGPSMSPQDRPDACEIGATWLAHSAQHTRCNTEAKFLMLSHAFDTWAVHRVMLQTDALNQRSRHAIERLGAKLDGILRAHKPAADGSVRDSAVYSILAAEWPQVRARLVDLLARDSTVR
jgi:N-acetyltransferase